MPMQPYANPDSGIAAFETGPDYIRLRFDDGGVYLYTTRRPGRRHVEAMKRLARSGEGLNTYLNQHVRERYERREA